nr:immunoglobulin heavy chain junction region [Mus musculus]
CARGLRGYAMDYW